MKFSGLYSSLILTIQKLVLLMTHLTGTSTYVRVGGSYSDSNTQPGLFSPNHEEEHSYASHGVGTECCGKVFYSNYESGSKYYFVSSGIGTFSSIEGINHVNTACRVYLTPTTEAAKCNYNGDNGQCPKGWGNYTSYSKYKPGCWNGTYYPNPTQAGTFISNTGSLAHYHQSGNNTALRVGNNPSGSGEAGVFHSTAATEQTAASHGEGTDYCGRVFFVYTGRHEYYQLSTGIGEYSDVDGVSTVPSDCLAYSHYNYDSAACRVYPNGVCPLGWHNLSAYNSYSPGCSYGTYYPNPTPASNTDLYTGSRTMFIATITAATLIVPDQISIGPAHPVFSLFVYGILTIIYMVLCAANRFDFYKVQMCKNTAFVFIIVPAAVSRFTSNLTRRPPIMIAQYTVYRTVSGIFEGDCLDGRGTSSERN